MSRDFLFPCIGKDIYFIPISTPQKTQACGNQDGEYQFYSSNPNVDILFYPHTYKNWPLSSYHNENPAFHNISL